MDAIASKGRGRPRKTVDDAQDRREVSVGNHNDTGNGKAGEAGIAAQADIARQSATNSWVDFCDYLRGLEQNRQIKAVFFPNPKQATIKLLNGRIAPAIKGSAAYELADGSVVCL